MTLKDLWKLYEADKRILGFSTHTMKAYFLQLKMLSKMYVISNCKHFDYNFFDSLMFTTVLNELMIEPDEAVFIDDSINNLEGVKKLGIHTIWLLRDRNVVREGQYISINDLHQLMTIVINTALLLNIFYMST